MAYIDCNTLDHPLFSICIPQYNRTSFLLCALESFREQTFGNFEVCISDDCSTDGRSEELIAHLRSSGMSFRFCRRSDNGRYDKNLRSSISLARGRYCLLMGNDDKLATPHILQFLSERLSENQWPEVVIANYHDIETGITFRRIQATAMRGAGPFVAVRNYRNFAFVSGLLLQRALAQKHTTDKWDGSEMYQMFLGTRMIAEGGRLLGLSDVIVEQNLQVAGAKVDHYSRKPIIVNCPIQERSLPLIQYARVAYDAVSPFVNGGERSSMARQIFTQFFQFTYPPWLVEYRRIQSWRYALGVSLGMRPKNSLRDVPLGTLTKLYLRGLFVLVTLVGLVVPVRLFEALRPHLHAFAKAPNKR